MHQGALTCTHFGPQNDKDVGMMHMEHEQAIQQLLMEMPVVYFKKRWSTHNGLLFHSLHLKASNNFPAQSLW